MTRNYTEKICTICESKNVETQWDMYNGRPFSKYWCYHCQKYVTVKEK